MMILTASLLSLGFMTVFLRLAGRYGWGKSIRKAGPESHLIKEGTPTMGGGAFLLAAVLGWLLLGDKTADSLALVLLVLASAGVGLYDDLLSLERKRRVAVGEDASTGLLARYRLMAQGASAFLFSLYAVFSGHPFFGIAALDVLAYTFIIMGAINALNLSDGLDGLAGGMAALILLPFIGLPFAGALLGALLGFLWFNAHPAKVFMGGVGSEALGAALAGIAILSGWTWWLPLLALMPVLEVLSVMLQVTYFKATGGKRIFKSTPFHHHFELSGWSEVQVVLRFWLVTAACVALAWSLQGGRL